MNRITLAFIIAAIAAVSFTADARNTRIVNGSNAEKGQFPHQASIRGCMNSKHYCSGAIIHPRWILTAASCVRFGMRMCAYVGATRLNDQSNLYGIDKIDFHPKYRGTSKRYDIAMLRTRDTIQFTEFVQPIALPSQNTPGDVPVTVAGWGTLSNIKATRGNELLPNRLQFLNTQTISVAACEKAFENEPDVLHANNLTEVVCAYTEDAGICLGDLGNPLITNDKTVVGIVSWGILCAQGYPDGYTRVHTHLDYINDVIEDETDDWSI